MIATVLRISAAAAVSAVCAACGHQPAQPDGAGSPEDSPITTSAGEYTLVASGDGWAANIPITFRNVTGERLYIVNCRGGLAPALEKQTDGGWEPFWAGVQLQCLSPPIVIEPGASITDTVAIWGALPGGNTMPAFASADLEGTYRIVLHSVVHNYDDSYSAGRFGDPVPVEQRVSNTFRLRRQ